MAVYEKEKLRRTNHGDDQIILGYLMLTLVVKSVTSCSIGQRAALGCNSRQLALRMTSPKTIPIVSFYEWLGILTKLTGSPI